MVVIGSAEAQLTILFHRSKQELVISLVVGLFLHDIAQWVNDDVGSV
jgi:hypothetical protein